MKQREDPEQRREQQRRKRAAEKEQQRREKDREREQRKRTEKERKEGKTCVPNLQRPWVHQLLIEEEMKFPASSASSLFGISQISIPPFDEFLVSKGCVSHRLSKTK
jgi:response regulator of citrate/malate metabolism